MQVGLGTESLGYRILRTRLHLLRAFRLALATFDLIYLAFDHATTVRIMYLRLNNREAIAAPRIAPPIAHPTAAPATAPVETPELEPWVELELALEIAL